jgi:DNA (cytosine-5)-methyltransferase 1
MKIGSLCTGYGGLDMAVEAYFGAETVWCAEFDKNVSQLIEQKLGYLNHGDIKAINWAEVEPIDILTAGYPCQPFSQAGGRKGTTDDRHIFPFILEAISVLRPRWVVLENVRGHLSLGFKEVLASLTGIGYDARWKVVRASDVGAPHQRARLFIVAYPTSLRCKDKLCDKESDQFINGLITDSNCDAHTQPRRADRGLSEQNQGLRDGQDQRETWHKYRSSAEMARQELPDTLDELGRLNPAFVEYMMGLPKGWVSDTNLPRTQQLKILGNGVVPQQAYYAIQQLMELDTPSEQDLF